jgi:hypothetical protein
VLILSQGCTTTKEPQIEYITVKPKISIPVKPVLPVETLRGKPTCSDTVTAGCISYQDVLKAQVASLEVCTGYVKELETLIKPLTQ